VPRRPHSRHERLIGIDIDEASSTVDLAKLELQAPQMAVERPVA
jgi:hypothetical protein